VPVFVQLSDLQRRDLILLVYPSSSLLDHILLLLRVASMPHLETCTRMIGDGTCTIQSKDQIGLVTRMLYII